MKETQIIKENMSGARERSHSDKVDLNSSDESGSASARDRSLRVAKDT
jgi:hypothetical protein